MNKSQEMATYILENNLSGRASDIVAMFNSRYHKTFSVSDVHNGFRLIEKGFTVESPTPAPSLTVLRKAKRNERKDSTWHEYGAMVLKDAKRFSASERKKLADFFSQTLVEDAA